MKLTLLLTLAAILVTAQAKIYKRCDLARELVFKRGISKSQVANWVCLATAESGLNTAAVGGPNYDGSYDYGIFQINNHYWCYPGGFNECHVKCSDLLQSDISLSVKCAKLILHRQGFEAWYGWQKKCRGRDLTPYIKGCF